MDRVVAGEQIGENKITLLVAFRSGGDVGCAVRRAYFGACDHGAALVGDAADDGAAAFLRVSQGGEREDCNGKSCMKRHCGFTIHRREPQLQPLSLPTGRESRKRVKSSVASAIAPQRS